MKGRKPNPENLRLTGTVSATERMAIGGCTPPIAPDWLCEEARVEWDRIVPELAKSYLVTPVDMATLAAYCQSYASWKQAELKVRSEGQTVYDHRGCIKLHPLARYAMQLLAELRRLAAEFGFSPAARTRIDAPSGQSDEDRDFDKGMQ